MSLRGYPQSCTGFAAVQCTAFVALHFRAFCCPAGRQNFRCWGSSVRIINLVCFYSHWNYTKSKTSGKLRWVQCLKTQFWISCLRQLWSVLLPALLESIFATNKKLQLRMKLHRKRTFLTGFLFPACRGCSDFGSSSHILWSINLPAKIETCVPDLGKDE